MTPQAQSGSSLAAAAAARPEVTAGSVCAHLAHSFQVQPTEVALLRLEDEVLRFPFPRELVHIGCIPLNGPAVAARTARSQRAELLNNFFATPHWSVFENVRLHEDKDKARMPIQKLMSVPIIGTDEIVLGVVQISRKAATREEAGPDFSFGDLQRLKLAAAEIARVMLQVSAPERRPGQKLCFGNHRPAIKPASERAGG
jgi:hypothetical protein